jgi:DNA-binding NarL/FixJ family response regulator
MKEETGAALAQVSTRLSQIMRLLALSLVAGKKQREQIAVLSRAGLDRHEIAEILGTTPGTVSVELSLIKRNTKKSLDKER